MHALFSTTAGAGHFGPLVPIARACVAAGHQVTVTAPASFADTVARSGLEFRPFSDPPREQMAAVFERLPDLSNEEANRIVLAEIFAGLDARAALPDIMDLVAEIRPDIVVRDPGELGSLLAARRAEIPQVQVAISVNQMLLDMAASVDQPLRDLAASVGLTTASGADLLLEAPILSSVPRTIDATAAGDRRIHRYRVERAADGPALPMSWGDPDAPLVYVSFGSVAATIGPFAALYGAVLDALADLPIRVLMTTGSGLDLGALGAVPANAHVAAWWPQEAAMREANLVVGHGGFGTTMSAVAAGVPQVVMPLFSSDQFRNADRIAAVGAGRRLLGGAEAVDALPEAVRDVSSDERYAVRARALAAEMAALPAVEAMVPVIEGLARTPTRP